MSHRRIVALALGLAAMVVPDGQAVFAQRVSNNAYRQPFQRPAGPIRGRTSQAAYAQEELPTMGEHSRLAPSQPIPPGGTHADPFSDDSGPIQEYSPAGECCDDYCGDAMCDAGCCGSCDTGCCGTCDGYGSSYSSGQCFVTADYLYVRSSFSDSPAVVEVDQLGLESDRNITQLDFDYESSFRVGGGYRLCGCGDEIRFMYTRLESSAFLQQDGGDGIFAPFFGAVGSGDEVFVNADVEINSYELEYAKTMPLGGGSGDGCGSACGYGDGCGSCPAWDLRWAGGFRAAEAEWNRFHVYSDNIDQLDGTAVSSMDFEGAGLKVGLEGRRYFCRTGWLSVYAKGDFSLLYGDLDFDTVRTIDNGTAADQIARQSTNTNQIIPVTELEAGVSSQVSCYGRISAGYMLSAWHDLGFRDNVIVDTGTPLQIPYDDANILGFDGFFARLEFAY